MSIAERYRRAVRLTAPKVAAELLTAGLEGYWLDETRYYFPAESVDPSLGTLVTVPSIADCVSGSVAPIIPLVALAGVLATHSGQPLDVETIGGAAFDMRDGDTLAVSTGGKDYLIDTQKRRVVAATDSLEMPAAYSPDGRFACFVRGLDLWLKERHTGTERPLTTDGATHDCYGQESETCLSALSYRQRPTPVGLWSPDSTWFLTHRVDERSLPEMALIQHVPPSGGRPVLHRYRYSMPGDSLPTATYVAIHIASGRIVTFKDFAVPILSLSPFDGHRVWFGPPETAWFVRLDRYAQRVDLIELNLSQGTGRIVLSEQAAAGYLDLGPRFIGAPNVRTLSGTDEVIWFSERDGWGHLYLYDALTGSLKNRITQGDWRVTDIVHIDERNRKLWFLAAGIETEADPARRSLCAVDFDGHRFEVLLSCDGDTFVPGTSLCGVGQERPYRPQGATAGLSRDLRFCVVRYASVGRGDITEIVDLSTKRGFSLEKIVPRDNEGPVRPFTARAADDETPLRGVLFLPSDFDERRQYPLIDYIYPGPQTTHQPQRHGAVNSALARALAELGFVTLMLDTRGTSINGRDFHQVGYGALLEPQLSDHATAVRSLCERHTFIDPKRIGIIGESAGGAAAARAMFDYGDLYKVGVAVSGNHDSSYYAALWSDKYRGPGGVDAWAGQANGAAAHKLEGKLLLISGDMDENVHVSQTLSLVDSLIRANRDFDLLIVPNAGHDVLNTHGYTLRRVWDYFVRNLSGEEPPRGFNIQFTKHELDRYATCSMREARQ
jgi:dipeptidyl-peptidase-4